MGLQPQLPCKMWFAPWKVTRFFVLGKTNILAKESRGNMVRTHTYAHPQLIIVVKHLMHNRHWCGAPLEWVYGLNYHSTLWFAPRR